MGQLYKIQCRGENRARIDECKLDMFADNDKLMIGGAESAFRPGRVEPAKYFVMGLRSAYLRDVSSEQVVFSLLWRCGELNRLAKWYTRMTKWGWKLRFLM